MASEKKIILNDRQIRQKLTRIVYQIYENNADEKEIILAGVVKRGYTLTEIIKNELEKVVPFKITLGKITLDKDNPDESTTSTDLTADQITGKPVVVVDDVLNSGRTLMFALQPFVNAKAKNIQTVVLANRSHKKFPVLANYVGISVATTVSDHITFEKKGDKMTVYLG